MLSPCIGLDCSEKFGIKIRPRLIPIRQVELLFKHASMFMNSIRHVLPRYLVTIHSLNTSISSRSSRRETMSTLIIFRIAKVSLQMASRATFAPLVSFRSSTAVIPSSMQRCFRSFCWFCWSLLCAFLIMVIIPTCSLKIPTTRATW